MKAEKAEWNPPEDKRRAITQSHIALDGMAVGQVIRITHDDVKCEVGKGGLCGLQGIRSRLKKKGKQFTSYHEAPAVAVVKRIR